MRRFGFTGIAMAMIMAVGALSGCGGGSETSKKDNGGKNLKVALFVLRQGKMTMGTIRRQLKA